MKHRVCFLVGVVFMVGMFLSCTQDSGPLAPVTDDQAGSPVIASRPTTGVLRTPEALERTSASFTLPDGRVVERRVHIFYRKGFEHKPNHPGGGGKGGGDRCFALLANGARWKTAEPYLVDPNLSGFDADFAASLSPWEVASGADIFGNGTVSDTSLTADTDATDGLNEVMFGVIEDPGVIAVTIIWGIFAGPPKGRELVEWDMVFNTDFNWGNAGPTNETGLGDTAIMDFLNIATHETGHAAGLGHPSDACTEETMYRFAETGETKKRTLHTGDIAGIKDLYK